MYFKLGDDYLVNYTAANNTEITIPPVKFGSTELGTSFSVLAKADASGQLVLSGYFDMMTFAYANQVTAGCSDLTFYAVELKNDGKDLWSFNSDGSLDVLVKGNVIMFMQLRFSISKKCR